jgi:RNA-directed DNA polymerase
MVPHAQGEGAQWHRKREQANLAATTREHVMDIAKVQKLLATKAQYQPQHQFNDLYRYVRNREWLEQARRNILQNSGANTPGIDGVKARDLSDTDWRELIDHTLEELRNSTFRPLPARRVYIPKANGKLRPLGIPTLRDRMVQEVLRMLLEPIYESHFLKCSHSFRPARSTMTAIDRVQHLCAETRKYFWVVEGDIKGCFDNIPHTPLMQALRKVIADEKLLSLIGAFLKAGYEEDGTVHYPDTGTPQGGIVSPLLANIYLHEMDKVWWERYGKLSQTQRRTRRQHGKGNIQLVRYADDFLILTNGTKAAAEAAKAEFSDVLNQMGLTLSPEKTLITHVNDGLDFLGFHIQRKPRRSQPGTKALYVCPTARAIQRYKDKIRKLLSNTHGDVVNKIRAVNRVVRGWGNYYRHVQSSRIRQKLDHWTYVAVFRWLGRKHGKHMGKKRLYDLYILRNAKGCKVLGYGSAHLARMGEIPTKRYYSPKGGIQNPYLTPDTADWTIAPEDPLNEIVWDGTSTQKPFALIRQDLLMQCGPICFGCKRTFPQHQLHAHHLQAQRLGGQHEHTNLRLLCPDCHQKTRSYGNGKA